MKPLTLLAASLLGLAAGGAGEPTVTPLPNAHAHNDYEHRRPLLDALDQGFCSVEADIWLVDGQLLVAHDRSGVKPERTLQALYLAPLRARVEANGGRLYRGGPECFLLVDIKSEAEPTYAALRGVLKEYAPMLTAFRADATLTNAITVILSGNSPRAALAAETERFAALDGRLPDLAGTANRHLIPWISDNWVPNFRWRGQGEFPAEESDKLRQLVAEAHKQGRRVRLWGAPDALPLWRAQLAAGVDFLNTDRLVNLRDFLLSVR